MLVFIKKVLYWIIIFIKFSKYTTSLNCISMKNQECKVRPEIISVNSNEPVFYPFSIKTSKFSGSCNNINDPYAKLRVPENTSTRFKVVVKINHPSPPTPV